MGHQIIKQPNGKYAVWSSIATDFVMVDATPADIIEMEVESERERIEKEVIDKVAQMEAGQEPYHQRTMTWEEALVRRDEFHGPETRFFQNDDFLPDGGA